LERGRGSRGVHGKRSTRSNRKIRRRLKTRRKDNTVEGEDLRSRFSYILSQASFDHISTNSLMISMVSKLA